MRVTLRGLSWVSTLTQPQGRVQRLIVNASGVPLRVSTLTQPQGRVQQGIGICCRAGYEFQPSPNLKAGCNAGVEAERRRGRAVSTLTQPQGRVQHVSIAGKMDGGMFQPSPNLKAGCNA